MTLKSFNRLLLGAALAASGLVASTAAIAQAKEQFFPLLVYRSGAYAPNGTPWANGKQGYIKMINARDGGVNGVKLTFEECETGYATDRGVECYERLKTRPGVALFEPQSTGITFALTDKAPGDKIPLLTVGYGLSAAQDGFAFAWNFPIMGSYWTGADILVQHLTKKDGSLKGKKIALVYHDSPFGKEPIPLMQERAKLDGFELQLIPVTAPGVEQKAAWLQVRQSRPDYVFLWGWGIMNSTALKEAQATGYPREKMYGVWWAGAEPDVKDVGEGAKGYHALALNPSGQQPKVIQDILKYVHEKGQGTGPKDEVGSVLYTRGVLIQMLAIEGVRRAQERFGKGKVMTAEQVRWGLENLSLDQKRLDGLGFAGVLRPISTSCADHMGSTWARIQTWDGSKWAMTSDFMQADEQIIKPMVKAAADKYVSEKKLTRRTSADCQS
jgi:branched-chain amino acid transport system substrate-binding protein